MSEIDNSAKPDKSNMRSIAWYLFIAGMVLVGAHYFFLQKQHRQGDESWLISLELSHTTQQPETVISVQPPYESENIRLVGRTINHPGLSILPAVRKGTAKRGIRLYAHKPARYQASLEFSLQLSQTPHFHRAISSALTAKSRQLFLEDNEWSGLDDPKLEAKLIDIGLNTTSQKMLADNIFQFVQTLPGHNPGTVRKVPEILASLSANHREKAMLMVALSRKAGIPARVVAGLELKDDPSASPLYWAELNVSDQWLSYHPGLGYQYVLPINFIALDKYDGSIVTALSTALNVTTKNYAVDYDIMIERMPDTMASPDNTRHEWYQVFVLDRLSADIREQLSLLMLLPLGALLCSFVRQFAGLHSYGVFTPTILALAITYADREVVLLILAITLVLVYLGRPSFHQEMSRTPRLSIIFTLVATGMVMGVSVLDYFSLATDGHIILLPIVIITSLIDRFFSTIELNGYRTALIRLVWTMVLTFITLPVLQLNWLGGLFLRYPEAHLFTLSLLIMISSYPFGKYRLLVWPGFLLEPEKKKSNRPGKKHQ